MYLGWNPRNNNVENILQKNQWLKQKIDDGDEFSLVAAINGRDSSTQSFVFRCSPAIRKMFTDREDKVFTMFSKCKVYDHYSILQCFKCQGIGHHSSKCNAKETCVNCAGKHKSSECQHTGKSICVNCRQDNLEAEHRANSRSCPKIIAENNRIKNITYHGF